jgi:uncharacterized membrane protein
MAVFQEVTPLADGAGLDQSLRLLDLPPAWIVVLIVLPLFAGLAWVGYSRETLSRPMRATLTALRLAAFVLLGLVLARPVNVERREEVHPAEVVVLVDDSASMRRTDAYGDPAVARALETASGRPTDGATRLELAQAVLERELAPLLERGDYRMHLYGFSETAVPLADPAALTGRGGATHLGDALAQALSATRGVNLTDVVVVSDGRSNGGLPGSEAARLAATAGVPVHTLLVGDTRGEHNAVIELADAPGEALEGDELAVTVRARGGGTAAGATALVLLEELDESGTPLRLLAEEEVQLSEAGERVVLVAPSGDSGLRTGERRFRVSLPPLENESLVDDNRVEFGVHVSPSRVRVLFVEGYPRWEYRFVKNLLLRADRNVDVQCFLLSATKDFPQEASPTLTPLTSVPTSRQELLDNYDVVILGDVDPYGISPDPAKCEEFLDSLRAFVEAGGGLLFEAGEFYNPRAFGNTPLEDVLPVQLDPTRTLDFQGDSRTEFRPLVENPSSPHEILRLASDPELNRALWESESGLRGFYWYSPIHKVKPGAQVLLRHPTDRNVQSGENYPLMVLGYFPAGRTLMLAVDSTYRWRYRYGDRYLDTFWRNAVRWLALGRLKSGDRRYRLETSRTTYDLEDRIQLELRVLDQDFRPSEETQQRLSWAGPDGRTSELDVPLETGRPGVYRTALEVDRPGLYRAWVDREVGGRVQRVAAAEFEVVLPSRENQEPSPDPQALELLSEKTGGVFLSLGRARTLATQFPGGEERREPISSRLQDAWDGWHTLLLALGLLGTEWILRKRSELL